MSSVTDTLNRLVIEPAKRQTGSREVGWKATARHKTRELAADEGHAQEASSNPVAAL